MKVYSLFIHPYTLFHPRQTKVIVLSVFHLIKTFCLCARSWNYLGELSRRILINFMCIIKNHLHIKSIVNIVIITNMGKYFQVMLKPLGFMVD